VSNLRSRRLARWVAALALVALSLFPRSAWAVDVTFDPTQGRPGTIVAVDYECAQTPDGGHIGPPGDAVIFARRAARLEADTGYVDAGDPVLIEYPAAGLTYVGPRSTFVVPRVPPGSYVLYARCYEQDLLAPLLPGFSVLGAPDTSTEGVRTEPSGGWVLAAVAFGIALATIGALTKRRHETKPVERPTRRTRPAARRPRSDC
jgi:hypothetical protein